MDVNSAEELLSLDQSEVGEVLENGEKKVTPLPYFQLMILAIGLLASSVSMTYIFPFVVFMVEDFGYDRREVGSYAGLVASSLFLGRVVASWIVGVLSDYYGRRNFFLGCLVVGNVSTFLFGFSNGIGIIWYCIDYRYGNGIEVYYWYCWYCCFG